MTVTVHERLKYLFVSQGKKQRSVAHSIGLSPNTLGNYVNGASSIPHHIVVMLADCFDVSTDYLLCLTDVPNKPMRLTTQEQQIISDFRSLRKEHQQLVLKNLHNIMDLESIM